MCAHSLNPQNPGKPGQLGSPTLDPGNSGKSLSGGDSFYSSSLIQSRQEGEEKSPVQGEIQFRDWNKVGRSATGGNPYELAGTQYQRWRPSYPAQTVPYLLGRNQASSLKVLDCGAGAGKFTQLLAEYPFAQLNAVEPATEMVKQFRQLLPEIPIWQTTAECASTQLPTHEWDLITYAQCWHWLDPDATSAAAAALLKPAGRVAIIFNQLNVGFPWVKRLCRIMRSGDVHFPDRPPRLGPQFTSPQLKQFFWGQRLQVKDLYQLAQTRSSYLRASDAGKRHLQQNLHWYLEEHLWLDPEAWITLPYYTLVWTAQKVPV